MSRLVFRTSSLLLIIMLCFLLCILSFVGGLALGLPSAASEVATDQSSSDSREEGGGGAARRARNDTGTTLGLQAGRIVAKPIDLASRFTQGKVAQAGGASGVPTGFVNAEVDRQARSADHSVEAVNDTVRNSVTGQSAEGKAGDTKPPTVPVLKAEAAPNVVQTMFTLELGAFHTTSDAQAFASTILARGYPVEIIEQTTADGTVISRVESGRFADRALANETQKQIQTQLGLGATIVPAPRPTSSTPARPSPG
jgi:cell division septation protein DedD